MPTERQFAEHREWAAREKPPPADSSIPACVACGCQGNCECGHRPLGEPEHLCELDINDQYESHRCYCCRIAGIDAGDHLDGRQHHEWPEVTR